MKLQSNAPAPRPPLALAEFGRQIAKDSVTLWRWRRDGILPPEDLVNICGKLYLTGEGLDRFNARAKAGEFARKPTVPRRKGAA